MNWEILKCLSLTVIVIVLEILCHFLRKHNAWRPELNIYRYVSKISYVTTLVCDTDMLSSNLVS